MFPLTLYNFSKRQNSTAVPQTAGTVVDVVLKRETSLNNPIFILQGELPDYNYAQFRGAFYFINDVVSVRDNVFEIYCTLDVLATLRSDILNTSAFVEYANSGNNQIPDMRLNVEYGVRGVNVANAGSPIAYLNNSLNDVGRFITVLGQRTSETYFISDGAVEYLFDNVDTWADLAIDKTSLDTIIATGLQQIIGSGNAANCVRDAYCLPIVAPLSTLAGAEPIYLGTFNTRVQANRVLGAGNVEKTITVNIPHQYSDWRKQSPYEVCQLFLPLYGTINIPSDIACDSDALSIRGILNVRSGDFTYYISGSGRSEGEIVVGGNCSAPLAIGNANVSGAQGISSGVSLASTFMGNIAGPVNAMQLLSPVPHSVGQTGGISNRKTGATCFVYYRAVSDSPTAGAGVQGIPLYATRLLSTLSGYVKTNGASVGGNHRGALKDEVNSLLDSGVFLE